jgi:AhpD family alkylhydroperoxidase
MMRTMAAAPAVLDGYLQLSGALAEGTLPAKVRERLALAIGEANQCDYCVATHSAIGRTVGLTGDEIRDSRLGTAVDAKTDALIRFARKVVDARGRVTDRDLEQVRAAGISDGAIAEVVAQVALNIFTNYFNLVAGTEIDFPKAPRL